MTNCVQLHTSRLIGCAIISGQMEKQLKEIAQSKGIDIRFYF